MQPVLSVVVVHIPLEVEIGENNPQKERNFCPLSKIVNEVENLLNLKSVKIIATNYREFWKELRIRKSRQKK